MNKSGIVIEARLIYIQFGRLMLRSGGEKTEKLLSLSFLISRETLDDPLALKCSTELLLCSPDSFER